MLSKEIIEEIQQLQYYIYYKGMPKPDGWKSIAVMDKKETGFYGETFVKNGYVVIVFRGSEVPEDKKDVRNCLAYFIKKAPSQLINAEIFYNEMLALHGKNAKVIVSGYSLGGLLAQILGYKYKNLTYTFGAIGAGDYFGKVPENIDYIHNYGRATDIFFLSRFDKHIGKLYIIDSDKPGEFKWSNLNNHYPDHSKSSISSKEYIGTRNLPTNTDKKIFEGSAKFLGGVQTTARESKNLALSVHNASKKAGEKIAEIPAAVASKTKTTGAKALHSAKKYGVAVNSAKQQVYEKLRRAAQKAERLKEEEIKKVEKELAKYPDKIFKSGDGTHWGITKDGIYRHYKSLPKEIMHRVSEQSPSKTGTSSSSKKTVISVDDAIDKIVESPSIIKNISKENAKKLVTAVRERFKDDKELVRNFTTLVENSVDLIQHKTHAQKLQAKIERELALKTRTEVLKKAGFSPKYIEKYQKSKIHKDERPIADKDSKKIVESLRPAEKAARIIEDSMEKSHKPATDADKWLHRVLSEVSDPTREQQNSLAFDEIKSDASPKQTDEKPGKIGKKAGVMLLSLLLDSVFEKADNKTSDASSFKAAELKKGYTNPILNSNKIFTLESIQSMTESERKKHEKAISYQKKTIGIPTRKEAQKETAKGGLVYVKAYTRSDGVNVKSYYRARPD